MFKINGYIERHLMMFHLWYWHWCTLIEYRWGVYKRSSYKQILCNSLWLFRNVIQWSDKTTWDNFDILYYRLLFFYMYYPFCWIFLALRISFIGPTNQENRVAHICNMGPPWNTLTCHLIRECHSCQMNSVPNIIVFSSAQLGKSLGKILLDKKKKISPNIRSEPSRCLNWNTVFDLYL